MGSSEKQYARAGDERRAQAVSDPRFQLLTRYTYRLSANEQIMRTLLRNKIPFFPHLTVSWSLPVARIIFLKSSQIQSGGFTNLLRKSVKCLERIRSALQRKRSGILLSPATNLLSVRFHIVDKYLHSLII